MGDQLSFEASSRTLETEAGPLHYHEAGEGPPFVLLHGSGPGVSGWSNFRGNLPVFAGHFRTLILDMPGFGKSPAITPYERSYPEVAADAVLRFLDGLGIDRIHLLGNSMGGWVAGTFVLAHPDRANRLVLMGPGGLAAPVFAPALSEGARRMFEFIDHPSREGMIAWVDTMVADRALMTEELIDERMANASRPGAVDSIKAMLASLFDPALQPSAPIWARAAEIAAPTLITWGRDDRMVPYDGAAIVFRQIPDAELHVFSRCGHWAQVERKSDFERLVIEFLTR